MNKNDSILSSGITLLLVSVVSFIISCGGIQPRPEPSQKPDTTFQVETKTTQTYTPPAQVEALSESAAADRYILGPGDVMSLKVWKRPEVSDPEIIIGPDGIITVPRIGFIQASGRTREDIAAEITEKLRRYYSNPEVSLAVTVYKNNKAFVLGRVEHPGVVTFPGKGTLLEALSMAGGYSTEAEDTYLTKCAIIRGKNTIIWIDLNDLLQNGNMALNARIKNNDVIFIPESQTELVYVMGEVYKPGVFPLTGRLTLMDALMMAGGPTENANTDKLFMIRPKGNGKGVVQEISLRHMLETGDFSKNYLMKDNDVIFVAEKGISKFNYVMKQILPSLEVLDMGTSVLESFGVMQEIRNRLWGQEGTVGK